MTHEELKTLTHAYDGFFTIENSMMPIYYRDMFAKKCRCGAEIIVSADNTQPQCCNPSCWVKKAYRFAYFCQALGYKGIGPKTALLIFVRLRKQMPYDSFLSVFCLSSSDISSAVGVPTAETIEHIKEDLKKRAVSFVDAVNALAINGIGARSALFDSVGDIASLLRASLYEKTDELCDRAGIQAEQTRFALKEAQADIILLAKDVVPNIISTPANDVYLMITGHVSVNGKGYSREEFIDLCSELKDETGRPAYNLIQTKSRSLLQYAIADEPSSSSKYVLGKELGIIVTAQQFYDLLKTKLGVSESGREQ